MCGSRGRERDGASQIYQQLIPTLDSHNCQLFISPTNTHTHTPSVKQSCHRHTAEQTLYPTLSVTVIDILPNAELQRRGIHSRSPCS